MMKLLNKLIPLKKGIKRIIDNKGYNCVLQSVVKLDSNELPSLGLNNSAIDFLNFVGGEYDIDLYSED